MTSSIDNRQASLALTSFIPLTGVFGSGGEPLGSIRTFLGNFALSGSDTAQGQFLPVNQDSALFSLFGGFPYGGNGVSAFALPNLDGRTAIGAGGSQPLGAAIGSASVTLTDGQLPQSVGGGGQAFDNYQPSLAINYLVRVQGIFPPTGDGSGLDGPGSADFLGGILAYAGDINSSLPAGYLPADGRLLSIAQNQALYLLYGTTYGGDGINTFALPDLRDRTIVGASAGSPLGTPEGQAQATVTSANLPVADGGSGLALDNRQPSLALTYIIATSAPLYPSLNGGGVDGNNVYLGEVLPWAGKTIPAGFLPAAGQVLFISEFQLLYSLIGATYGGDGVVTFALPDLRDRTVVGIGANPVGTALGTNSVTLTTAQLPGNDIVSSGQDVIVSAGQLIFGAVLSGGTVDVRSGGTAHFTLSGGTENISAGGTAFNTIVSTGGHLVVGSGGVADPTTVFGGGTETVSTSGTDTGALISGGEQDVFGVAVGATVFTGSQLVESGGTASNTIVSGGTDFVSAGGTADQVTVQPGGLLVVWGTVTGTVTVAGREVVELGGSATASGSGTLVSGGGTVSVLGGEIDHATIFDGGNLNVSAGSASFVTVSDGGRLSLSSATAVDVTVLAGGFAVATGGHTSGTIVSSGGTLNDIGSATSTTLDGGQESVGFGADENGATVNNGGVLTVERQGRTESTVIGSGGTELVLSRGTASDTMIGGGTLDVQPGGIVSGSVSFSGSGGTFEIEGQPAPGTLANGATISGFVAGDTIDLRGLSGGGHVDLVGHQLQVTLGGQQYDLDLDTTQNFAGDFFHLTSDGFGGTAVNEDTTPCYCGGTLIATERGEVAVEALVIGDRVITSSGLSRPIRWIGRRSYSGRFALGQKHILPICIKAGALDEGVPRRDLWISPHHAMYLDGVLIEARNLVNGSSIVQADRVEKVEYFHLELDTHDVIIAEGALSESFIDDDSRGMFHNAPEYRVLYPDAPRSPVRYCAPRREEGYELDAARRRIAARAGLRSAAELAALALRGFVDVVSPRRIAGWAQSTAHPEAPVCLDILVAGRRIGQTLANRYREDLARAGLGSGRHGFEFTPPAGLDFAPHAITVRRSLDGCALDLSADAEHALARAAARGAESTKRAKRTKSTKRKRAANG